MEKEQRRNFRLECKGTARFYTLAGAPPCSAWIADISLEGCLVVLDEAKVVPAEEFVELAFSVNNLPFRLRGQVKTIRSSTVLGLEFDRVSERARLQIVELVEELTAEGKRRERNKAITNEGRVTADLL